MKNAVLAISLIVAVLLISARWSSKARKQTPRAQSEAERGMFGKNTDAQRKLGRALV